MPIYTFIPNSDLDVNSPAKTGVMILLRDNVDALRLKSANAIFSEVSNNTTGYVTKYTFYVDLPDRPDYTGIQRKLEFLDGFEIKHTGANAGNFKLRDVGAGVDSGVVATTSGYAVVTLITLNFASGLKGTRRQIAVMLQAGASSVAYCRSLDSVSDPAVQRGQGVVVY